MRKIWMVSIYRLNISHQTILFVIDSSTVFIEPDLFTDLRNEANKLKSWRKLNKINSDKLVKLLMVLEKIVRDVMDEDGMLTVRIDTEDVCF